MASTTKLIPGDWVEVRSAEEIFATLDENGCIDGMPFMAEMLPYCGRRYRVFKRADKTCDMSSPDWGLRRLQDSVILALLRCTGAAHGGCQAGCLFFWKESWLKRVESGNPAPSLNGNGAAHDQHTRIDNGHVATTSVEQSVVGTLACAINSVEQLRQSGCVPAPDGSQNAYYRCQATEIARATTRLPWWEPMQYVRDMYFNGVSFFDVVRGLALSMFNRMLKKLGLPTYPLARGRLTRTPLEELNLQAGELVEVKSREEILATLDSSGKNRGMTFDAEMIPYCGKRYRVLRRVERLVNERTGQFFKMPNPSIILNDVVCTARYHRFCPRGTFPFWREIWLRRVQDEQVADQASEPMVHQRPVEEQADHTTLVGT